MPRLQGLWEKGSKFFRLLRLLVWDHTQSEHRAGLRERVIGGFWLYRFCAALTRSGRPVLLATSRSCQGLGLKN